MIKILALGSQVESTGEVRVTVLDTALTKTASNDIQTFWTSLERDPSKAYLHVIAMTAIGWYACNNNGDAFTEEDLRQYHPSFISDANIFMHHANKDPKKSHGKVIYSFYNEPMHRIELVMALEKSKAPQIVDAIKRGEPIAVSMGVRVKFDKCSICGNEAKTRQEYCDHLKYNMKKILEDGKQVYALNPGPLKFFDISIVNRPADKTAWALQKAAAVEGGDSVEKTSAELGEEYGDTQEKLAALTKFSEILKQVEGTPLTLKDGDVTFNVHRALRDNALAGDVDFALPQLSFSEMKDSAVSPGGLIQQIVGSGVAPSLSELAFASGKHYLGDSFREDHVPLMLGNLGHCTKMLQRRPSLMGSLISAVTGDMGQGADGVQISINIQPMAKKRRALILQLAGPDIIHSHEKTASAVLKSLPVSNVVYENSRDGLPFRRVRRDLSRALTTTGPGTTEVLTVRGSDGSHYATDRGSVRAANSLESVPDLANGLTTASLALAAFGAAVSDSPTATKLLVTPILAALAAGVSQWKSHSDVIESEQGVEIPSSSVFTRVKEGQEKWAMDPKLLAPALGATIPAVLGLDYLYNKHIRHKGNPYYRQGLTGTGRAMDTTGERVIARPLTALAAGAVAGGAAPHMKWKAIGSELWGAAKRLKKS